MSTHAMRNEALTAQQLPCPYCGNAMDGTCGRFPTRDHIVPKSRGGARGDPSNILVVCFKCNNQKGDMLLSEWIMELMFGPPSRSAKVELVKAVLAARSGIVEVVYKPRAMSTPSSEPAPVKWGPAGPACALVRKPMAMAAE